MDIDPKIELRPTKKVEYKRITVEYISKRDLEEEQFVRELQASGLTTEVKYMIPGKTQNVLCYNGNILYQFAYS